jgi:rod shape-determining protein MreC
VTPRWTRTLLAALLVGQLFLLAAQTPGPAGTGTLLETGALAVLGPLARLVDRVADGLSGARRATVSRAALEQENQRLRAELLELRRERLRGAALDQEVEALARGLDYARRTGYELVAAEVVYLDAESWLKSLVVHVGAHGARVDQPVVTELGVVGRVIAAAGGYAKVQLITDSAASVGVLLEAARRQGIVRGAPRGRLALDFLPRQVPVEVGDRVLTAGIDGVYPRGLPVGTIARVEPGTEMFHAIEVEPAVDLARLDYVFLLERPGPPAELVPRGSGVRP